MLAWRVFLGNGSDCIASVGYMAQCWSTASCRTLSIIQACLVTPIQTLNMIHGPVVTRDSDIECFPVTIVGPSFQGRYVCSRHDQS